MHTDPLKHALTDMETAWSRLREVLDGPDVAAALASCPRTMSTAPKDGTWITLHLHHGGEVACHWLGAMGWVDDFRQCIHDDAIKGWSPVK